MQGEAQNFKNQNQNKIQQLIKAHRDGLVEEITLVVKTMARSKGATLVLDKSVSVYCDDAFDMTEDVIKEVNKDRPPAPPAPVAAPADAAPAAAAATPAPAATPVPAK